jgi:hypothetical protein
MEVINGSRMGGTFISFGMRFERRKGLEGMKRTRKEGVGRDEGG